MKERPVFEATLYTRGSNFLQFSCFSTDVCHRLLRLFRLSNDLAIGGSGKSKQAKTTATATAAKGKRNGRWLISLRQKKKKKKNSGGNCSTPCWFDQQVISFCFLFCCYVYTETISCNDCFGLFTAVIAEVFECKLIPYVSYFWLKVRNLEAYENLARIQVYVTLPSLYENL